MNDTLVFARRGAPEGFRQAAIPWILCLGTLACALLAAAAPAGAARQLSAQFSAHTADSKLRVDHSAWDRLLKAYRRLGDDGVARFDYAGLRQGGLNSLRRYLDKLQSIDPATLARGEQFAFWANLYNAKTVEIVASRYPVKSIRAIRLSGFLVPGPWRREVLEVTGVPLSLDDIEHGILRPIWRDPRIHYAVNCASIGCPNLPGRAWTGDKLEKRLDAAARAYVNSSRGVRFEGGRLIVSSLYDWYSGDFGGTQPRILKHIRGYATPETRRKLSRKSRIDGFEYDWKLNGTR